MSYKGTVTTGRGGAGNALAGPAKLGQSVIDTHPQTAHILAQHEANITAYERAVVARHKEAKANRPRVSGRGGIGNITESDPRSSSKPLRRASLFKGGGDAIAALSSPKDRLDMNAYDERERLDYAREKGLSRATNSMTATSPSPSRSTFSASDSISEVYSSSDSALSQPPPSIISVAHTQRPARRSLAAVWRRVSFSRTPREREPNHTDLLNRVERAIKSMSHLPTPPPSLTTTTTDFVDISRDALYFNPAEKHRRSRGHEPLSLTAYL